MAANLEHHREALIRVLGYLNFSSGSSDPQFLTSLNALYPADFTDSFSPWQAAEAWSSGEVLRDQDRVANDQNSQDASPVLRQLRFVLEEGLRDLRTTDPAFHDSVQAESVVRLVFDEILPGYRQYHQDLLFHHAPESLWRPLMVGRVIESVLQQGSPWDETERIVHGAITYLNDYLGHRPVPALESRKLEPYAHEWSRPIPLYIHGSTVSVGRYQKLIERCLDLLQRTEGELLRAAHFEFSQLQELAIDPRSCDFDHPASKRPNYLFGQWDAHQIDQRGYYHRFVLRDITLDALMQRVEEGDQALRDQWLTEAATVLAGTILMASGISGSGPGAHDSTTTLGNLLPRIAIYRDQFYDFALQILDHDHRQRLEQEAAERKQPFGGARQDLNARLARHRALQVQYTQLAQTFARMGYPDAAVRQTALLPVASARMLCQMDCYLLDADLQNQQGDLASAVDRVSLAVQTLHRAIECGAVVDPWNILGFDSHYSLFPAPDNSVHDERVDILIELMERIFSLYAKIWSEAAAANDRTVSERIAVEFQQLANWWHQFAVHEVQSVEGVNAHEMYVAAERAATGLALWHEGGAATGDVRFWAPHAETFHSSEAFAMVVDALLDRKDHVASMSLLVFWLSQAGRVGLEQGDVSFHELTLRWLRQVKQAEIPADEKWSTIQKFFDYFEANAQEYWKVPDFDLDMDELPEHEEELTLDEFGEEPEEDEDEDDYGGLFDAAYEEVVYRDSTDDGIEGSIFDEDRTTEVELDEQTRYLSERLGLLECLAKLWRVACYQPADDGCFTDDRTQTLRRWLDQLLANRRDLLKLINNVQRFSLPTPAPTPDSLLQYDRHRLLKETILDKSISTSLATCDATRHVLAALISSDPELAVQIKPDKSALLERIEIEAAYITSAVFSDCVDDVKGRWVCFLQAMRDRTLLYVPLSRHGDPKKILRARVRQHIVTDLLQWLPRLGQLEEACALIDTARQMERNHPVGGAAVTEFDALFENGFQAIVQSIVESASTWSSDNPNTASLVDALEPLTQSMLVTWMSHSRTLRLSVLERISEEQEWDKLVEFIGTYGADLFTQSFLGLGNIRAILHQGVGEWLDQLAEDGAAHALELIDQIDRHLSHEDATDHVTLVLEAIVENYGEYRDYNSTTTQSDRGEMLFTLLDFLRLRVEYDRVTWNLKPVYIAHDVLVRKQRNADAEVWRRALVDRTQPRSDAFLDRLLELQQHHAMQMPTVADRLNGRFVRPMIIGRLCALVRPAMQEANQKGAKTAFDLLEQEAAAMAREPAGAGLELPDWLAAIDQEVRNVRTEMTHLQKKSTVDCPIAFRQLTWEQIQQQLSEWNDAQE